MWHEIHKLTDIGKGTVKLTLRIRKGEAKVNYGIHEVGRIIKWQNK